MHMGSLFILHEDVTSNCPTFATQLRQENSLSWSTDDLLAERLNSLSPLEP
jgi:hypothetical protein